VGTASVNASALLTMASTTQGFLPPSMTSTQKSAISSPASGLVVYDNVLNQIGFYNGTTWVSSAANVVNYTAVSSTPYTVKSTDYYLAVSAPGGGLTINLPSTPPAKGTIYIIKDTAGNSQSNNITVAAPSMVTIDGVSSYVINSSLESIQLIFNGTNYEVF
jgi:hypothetical protein